MKSLSLSMLSMVRRRAEISGHRFEKHAGAASWPAQAVQFTIAMYFQEGVTAINTSENKPDSASRSGEALAATFADRESANKALTELHLAGFRNVWLGVMQGDATPAADATFAFEGDGAEEQTLHQALIAHGLRHDQARQLEATTPSGAAIVIVDGEKDPAEARDILQVIGGNVDTDGLGSAPTPNVDDARRLQLREERLLIDKQRVASGEARVRKEVVAEQQSIDVPVVREELFIRRRAVDSETSTTPIGEDESEEIHIPLSADRVDVQKRTVVTEQVGIGKRTVEGTDHISETVRHEELRVEDDGLRTTNGEPEKQQTSSVS